jgi:DNA-binding CsgD family transcriptional regulator
MVDALMRDGLLHIASGVAELRSEPGTVPASLPAAIGRRLGFLDAGARAVLRIGSLLGSAFPVCELALGTGRPASDLVPAIEEAVETGVLAGGGNRMVFRHELIRQVLYEEIPAAMRAALHGQVARALAEAGRPMGRVAAHLLAAPAAVDDWALGWLAGLPSAGLYAAPRVAVKLLTRAVELVGFGDPRREVLGSRLATALYWLGRNDEVGPVANEVLRTTADPELAASMTWMIANAANRRGRYADALRTCRQALDDPTLPPRWRGRIRANYAVILLDSGQREQADAQALRALADSERSGDALGIGQARHALFKVAMLSDWATALEHLERGLASLGGDPESVELRLLMLSNSLIALFNLDRHDEYDSMLRQALVLAERAGTARLATIHMNAACVCYERGEWDEALVHLDTAMPPTGYHERLLMHGLYALIAARRQDRPAASRHCAAASGLPTTGHLRASASYLTMTSALMAEAAGDVRGAAEVLASWLDPALGPTYDRYQWMPDLVRLALAAGDTDTARAAAEACEADAADDALPVRVAAARRCRAQLVDDLGGLDQAADYYRRARRLVDLAATMEEVAVRQAQHGNPAAARAALTDAVRGYQEASASWDIRRADARLRAYGIRRGPRSLTQRPRFGWEALTPTERRIAKLVAHGQSNPDIAAELYLSRRTVQTHVSNILTKLDVRSRIDLVRDAARWSTENGSPVTPT